MSFRVTIEFDDGTSEDIDEVFETEEDAEEAAMQWSSDYSQGRDYLEEAGEDYCDANVIGWSIYEN